VNLFYANAKRKQSIINTLKKNGAKEILGVNSSSSTTLPGLDSARRIVDKNGIFAADVVIVPLEDGDRTIALRKIGKKVITFDLNPLSRTSQTANITIIDNVTRAMSLLIVECKNLSKKNKRTLEKIVNDFDNKKNISDNIIEIRDNLTRRSRIA
jgi:4-phosphopantoate--beta-alanine ligase